MLSAATSFGGIMKHGSRHACVFLKTSIISNGLQATETTLFFIELICWLSIGKQIDDAGVDLPNQLYQGQSLTHATSLIWECCSLGLLFQSTG
ncbi:MAG: hypothetical protein J0I92_22380, partial [Phyllobacterium sp.]|nr:hypothetical protein [Phyllobacterium sp.]